MTLSTELQTHAQALLSQLLALREAGVQMEQVLADELAAVSPELHASARNFAHYLAIRRQDIRPLQRDLAALGLSSLGVLESHVMASLNAVMARLEDLSDQEESSKPLAPADFVSGPGLLEEHADTLLGATHDGREVRIMVTLPSEAAHDPGLIQALIQTGMEVARINCAHDDAFAWQAMARHVREAAAAQGKVCRVQIDLAGPKSRTGSMRSLGRMLKIKPERDYRGRVLREALLWVTWLDTPQSLADSGLPQASSTVPCLLFEGDGLDALASDEVLTLHDARGRLREVRVVAANAAGALLGFDSASLLEEGCELRSSHKHKHALRGKLLGAPEVRRFAFKCGRWPCAYP